MITSGKSGGRAFLALELGVLGGVSAWLLVSAFLVDIEYYDGFDSISNSRHFLGLTERYIANRSPLMGLILAPAEWIKERMGLHPLEVRPHHLTLALLHIGYLVAVHLALRRAFGRGWAPLAAFVAAVPTFVFFSYAPFLSHDILPGAAFIWMLILGEEFSRSGRTRSWVLLVVLGALSALMKHTYALFWAVVLLVQGLAAALDPPPGRPGRLRRFLLLCLGAALSGAIAWVVLGWALEAFAPQAPLLARPYHQVLFLKGMYSERVVFPAWVYLRNFPAYGVLTTILFLPGLFLSLRGGWRERSLGLAWIAAFVPMQLLTLREVRYIAFLAPLTACLLVPALRLLSRSRVLTLAAGAVLLWDVAQACREASRIASPFYRQSELKRFLGALDDPRARPDWVLFRLSNLSFSYLEALPLAGDRYHRIFHFGRPHLECLYGYQAGQVLVLPSGDLQAQAAQASTQMPDGTLLLYANQLLVNGTSWTPRPPLDLDKLFQSLARLRTIPLERQAEGGHRTPEGKPVEIGMAQLPEGRAPVLGGEWAIEALREFYSPVVVLPEKGRSFRLVPLPGTLFFRVEGAEDTGELSAAGTLLLRGFHVLPPPPGPAKPSSSGGPGPARSRGTAGGPPGPPGATRAPFG